VQLYWPDVFEDVQAPPFVAAKATPASGEPLTENRGLSPIIAIIAERVCVPFDLFPFRRARYLKSEIYQLNSLIALALPNEDLQLH